LYKHSIELKTKTPPKSDPNNERGRNRGAGISSAGAGIGRRTEWFVLAFIILCVVLIRVRLLQVPLERDEGEYAYIGRVILRGIPPYLTAFDIKFPGSYMMYALLMALFGQTLSGVHLGVMVVNCITIVLIYLLGKRISGGLTPIVAAAAYAFMSTNISVLGFATHVTHFVVLFTIGGLLILFRTGQRGGSLAGYLLAGVVSGAALAVKQAALLLILAPVCSMIVTYFAAKPRKPVRDLALPLGGFALGVPLPLLATFGWLYLTGAFPKFWFWGVDFASRFGSQNGLAEGFQFFSMTFPSVVDGFALLWVMAALGLFTRLRGDARRADKSFIPLFALFSFLSVCPGLFFRQHYFITLLPAVAILAGTFTDYLKKRLEKGRSSASSTGIALGVVVVAICAGLISKQGYFFRDDVSLISRNAYGPNPFPESIPIADYIASRTGDTDRIAILGSEPQIYFYSGRDAVTPYIDTYNLMVHHPGALAMQKEMIHDIETSKPRYIVLAEVGGSWMAQPNSEMYIIGWYKTYLPKYYSVVGVADIISPDLTAYRWDAEAAKYLAHNNYLLLCERKKGAE
jgi:hypothetical protein